MNGILNLVGTKEGGGGVGVEEKGGCCHSLWDFCDFFLDDKTSAPDVFSGCLFIPCAHFETSLVMVGYYGFEIWRHK